MGTTYKHLSCEDRTMIQLSLEQGCTLRAIARSVQRAPSSVSRELKRNGWSNPAIAPKKRGVSFEEAQSVFYDEFAIQFFDDQHSSAEAR